MDKKKKHELRWISKSSSGSDEGDSKSSRRVVAIADTHEEAWAEHEAFMVELRKQRLREQQQKQGGGAKAAGRGEVGGVGGRGSATVEGEGAEVAVSNAGHRRGQRGFRHCNFIANRATAVPSKS